MNGKTSKAKPRMADVTKPKKLTPQDQLVIQSRPIIGRATSVSSPVDEAPKQDEVSSAPVLPSQSKRTLIVPISDGAPKAEEAPAENPATPTNTDNKTTTADEAPKAAAPVAPTAKKGVNVEPPAEAEKAESSTGDEATKDDEAATDETETENKDSKPNPETDDKDSKPNPETEKALAEAAAAEKRQKELEALIDSKQFYVPINAVARKRSIKYSSVMTVAVFLLAIVLIDLMLDTGMILLVQKIPHTHFFTQGSDTTTQIK